MAKLRYIFLYSLFLVFIPLVYTTSTYEAFMFPKTTLFYLLILILVLMCTLDLYRSSFPLDTKRLHCLKHYYPLLLLVIFLVSTLVSTIFSVDIYSSIMGYYSRFFGGLLSFLGLLIYFSVGYLIFSKEDIKLLFKLSLIPLLPISLYGILQHFYMPVGTSRVPRVYSTIGQPNWLAQYIVASLPFVLFFLTSLFRKAKKDVSTKLVFEFIYYTVLLGTMLLCLWYTVSLSGIVAFLVSVSLLFLYAVFSFFKSLFTLKKKYSVFISALLIVSLLFLLIYFVTYSVAEVSSNSVIRDRLKDAEVSLKFIRELDPYLLSPLSTSSGPSKSMVSYTVSDSLYIRYLLWVGTINLIRSSTKVFLIGTGPSTFAYNFYMFRPPSLNYSSEWDFVFNKPHNYYLEVFSETGLFGILSYTLLCLYVLYRLFNKLRTGDIFSLYVFISLFSLLISYIFGWPVVSDALIFWIGVIYAFI